MKPFILFLVGLSAPVALMAQDDMYFIPSQNEAEEVAVEEVQTEVQYDEEDTQDAYSYYTQSYDIRDVDEYNRRGSYVSLADSTEDDAATDEEADGDNETTEMSCTERIILFHSPTVGVWVSSPYYWDYYYYDYWWYDPWYTPYYAWHAWWWYGSWYAGWWGRPYWGWGFHPMHHHFADIGPRVGQWRQGPRGGYVSYGKGNRSFAATRATGTRGTYSASANRSFTNSGRRFTNSRSTVNSGQSTRSYNNSTRRFSTSNSRTTTQSSQRSYTPSRSVGSSSRSTISTSSRSAGSSFRSSGGGSGRSFGGRR